MYGSSRMKDLIENATIIYKNGTKKIFEVISITEKGVYTGFIKNINENKDVFVNNSFIPLDQIKNIIICGEKGELNILDFIKNKNVGGMKK